MANKYTYNAKDYLPIGSVPNSSQYIFLWEPTLYIELFEYARLAKSEGYPLADLPFFDDIEKNGIFKIWFSKHWRFFAVHKKLGNEDALAGITVTNSKKGFSVHFDKNSVSREQAIAFMEKLYDEPVDVTFPFSLSMSEIKAHAKEKLIHKLSEEWDWDDISHMDIAEGLLPVQRHLSRERMAYQAYSYYQQLLNDNDANDDLIRVYVAHALGFFKYGGRHYSQEHFSESLAMKIEQHRKIRNGTYDKGEFSFNGKPVTQQWLTWVETRKSKVADLITDCIKTFICLGEGVFPLTPDKRKESINLEPYIQAAAKNKKVVNVDPNRFLPSVDFVKTRIRGISPFRFFEFVQPHKFTNGFIRFEFSRDFASSSKQTQLNQLNKLMQQVMRLQDVDLNIVTDKQWVLYTKIYAALHYMLSLMRDYIEDELWFNDKESDPAEHLMAFEVDPLIGNALGRIFGSNSNK